MKLTEKIEQKGLIQERKINIEEIEKIDYISLEKIFTKKEYYEAMKTLKLREKQVLYLNILKKLPLGKIAILLNTTENNIYKIKHRAKNSFKKNLENGRRNNNERKRV